jgi:hypothetical protein
MNEQTTPAHSNSIEGINEVKALKRGLLLFLGLSLYFSAFVYCIELDFERYSIESQIAISEEIQYVLFAIVLSIIGTGLIIWSTTIKDLKK